MVRQEGIFTEDAMNRDIDWDLLDDQIAIQEGRDPLLVSRDERQRRVLSLIGKMIELADSLHITRTDLAKQSGVKYATLNRWQTGEQLPSNKHYRKLLELYAYMEKLPKD